MYIYTQSQLAHYVPCPWHTDIESQVAHLNTHLLQVLHDQCPPANSGPKKSFITAAVWDLRCHKLRLQRAVRDNRRVTKRELLHQVFSAWKGSSWSTGALFSQYRLTLDVCRVRLCSALCRRTRRLRSALKSAKLQEVHNQIEALPEDCAASQILHKLKTIVGSTNPKLRRTSPLPSILDAQGQPCQTPEALVDRWVEFFSVMEGGERLTEAELRTKWIASLQAFLQTDLHIAAADLPSLTELETAFRKVKANKAVGEDRIPPELCHLYPVQLARLTYGQLLKLCTHGQESLLHKGGTLVAAWKRKGSQLHCESYRSLLISSHIGKTVHRAVRDHQASIYEAYLQRQQVGGRRHISVSMGVHFIRAAARAAKRMKMSHAMIFLDLREAFYRVLRPLAVGGTIPDALLASVAERLRLPGEALSDLHALLRAPPSTEAAQMPSHLRRALLALHTNTHFRVPGQQDRIHTRIGSRPGDPLADVIFGYMFARILTTVEQRLLDLGLLETIEGPDSTGLFPHLASESMVQHTFLGPTWMDDLCVTASSATAHGLESKAGAAAGILLETCTSYGVSPNLDRGKSEILFSFRGPGSRGLRLKYFSTTQAGRMSVVTEYGTHEISIVGKYNHLGNLAHHSGTSHREIRTKFAVGNAALTAHRKLLFQNPNFSMQRRAELYKTLVHSKVAYGMETWTFEDKKTEKFYSSATLRLYRRLLKLPPDVGFSDDEIIERALLPSPEVALRITRLRYLALLYKCESVTLGSPTPR